jgi:hypothetical protein
MIKKIKETLFPTVKVVIDERPLKAKPKKKTVKKSPAKKTTVKKKVKKKTK